MPYQVLAALNLQKLRATRARLLYCFVFFIFGLSDFFSFCCLDQSAKRIKLDQHSVKSNLLGAFSKEDLNEDKFDLDADTVGSGFTRQRVFHRPLLGHDMITVTNTDGDRVLIKVIPDNDQRNKVRCCHH